MSYSFKPPGTTETYSTRNKAYPSLTAQPHIFVVPEVNRRSIDASGKQNMPAMMARRLQKRTGKPRVMLKKLNSTLPEMKVRKPKALAEIYS